MRKYAELVGLCGTCPIMRKIMRAHNRIIQPSLIYPMVPDLGSLLEQTKPFHILFKAILPYPIYFFNALYFHHCAFHSVDIILKE